MIDADYCRTMARYNQWMNDKLYEITSLLTQLGHDPGVTDLPFAPGLASLAR